VFFLGLAAQMGVIFSSGGLAKSRQFRVIGELLAGRHGATRRAVLVVGFLVAGVGALLLFAGVAQQDRLRAANCAAHCQKAGFEKGAIGPSDDPAKRVVSCTCTAADGRRQQFPANEVPAAP